MKDREANISNENITLLCWNCSRLFQPPSSLATGLCAECRKSCSDAEKNHLRIAELEAENKRLRKKLQAFRDQQNVPVRKVESTAKTKVLKQDDGYGQLFRHLTERRREG